MKNMAAKGAPKKFGKHRVKENRVKYDKDGNIFVREQLDRTSFHPKPSSSPAREKRLRRSFWSKVPALKSMKSMPTFGVTMNGVRKKTITTKVVLGAVALMLALSINGFVFIFIGGPGKNGNGRIYAMRIVSNIVSIVGLIGVGVFVYREGS